MTSASPQGLGALEGGMRASRAKRHPIAPSPDHQPERSILSPEMAPPAFLIHLFRKWQ